MSNYVKLKKRFNITYIGEFIGHKLVLSIIMKIRGFKEIRVSLLQMSLKVRTFIPLDVRGTPNGKEYSIYSLLTSETSFPH